ncbi:hypothetical protein JL721_1022 [Aureococcus anophagefferens]|nr:hypothetical protein JL721_1022 [Aureococcus anophagefferens]
MPRPDDDDAQAVALLDRIIGADPDNAGVRAQLQGTMWASPRLLLTAIHEQATTLGIDDEDFHWIAARSLLSPLPDGWAQYKDHEGNPYYLNEKTHESKWEHPLDEHYMALYRSYVSQRRDAPEVVLPTTPPRRDRGSRAPSPPPAPYERARDAQPYERARDAQPYERAREAPRYDAPRYDAPRYEPEAHGRSGAATRRRGALARRPRGVEALEGELERAEARARAAEELGKRLKLDDRAGSQVAALEADAAAKERTIADLEAKLHCALVAGEALQQECDDHAARAAAAVDGAAAAARGDREALEAAHEAEAALAAAEARAGRLEGAAEGAARAVDDMARQTEETYRRETRRLEAKCAELDDARQRERALRGPRGAPRRAEGGRAPRVLAAERAARKEAEDLVAAKGDEVAAARGDAARATSRAPRPTARRAGRDADAARARGDGAKTVAEEAIRDAKLAAAREDCDATRGDLERARRPRAEPRRRGGEAAPREGDFAAALSDARACEQLAANQKLRALDPPDVETLRRAVAEAAEARESYALERARRREIGEKLAVLQGNIRVIARCRPPVACETESGADVCAVSFPAGCDGDVTVTNDAGLKQRFEYDAVFKPGSTQAEVFEAICPLVQSAFDGFSVCIFAYGQTGSGKTHTMEGPPDDRGVYFRALRELFHARPPGAAVAVKLSMLEVYNETIVDLLADGGSRPKLEVRQTGSGHSVPGLTSLDVESLDEVQRLTERGGANRSVGGHDLNARSSRSHLIVALDVSTTVDGAERRARLNLVDLAGSERLSRTGATGDRLKEAQNINKSLSALGDVIAALAKKNAAHVPYRNSKLTFLLQDSLSRHAKVLMFVNMPGGVQRVRDHLLLAGRCR